MSKENTVKELPEDIEVIGPGQMLAEAREKIGLSQQQVADKLNFRVSLVKDIEADAFDRSLPTTFNRGYLKNYAKLVDISADEVLAGFEMLNVAQKQGAEMQSFSKQTEKQTENNIVMWISYLILAFLIGSTILWWLQDSKQTTSVKSSNTPTQDSSTLADETASQPIEVSQADDMPSEVIEDDLLPEKSNTATLSETLIETPTNVIEQVNLTVEETNNQPVSTGLTVDSASETDNPIISTDSEAVTEIIEDENLENQAEEVAIDFGPLETAVFTFSGDCWVNIYDATGERIAWGIKKSGYIMNISGQAPFTITLGKPELVAINFEEQTIDMSQFNRGNIAKFTLPLSN